MFSFVIYCKKQALTAEGIIFYQLCVNFLKQPLSAYMRPKLTCYKNVKSICIYVCHLSFHHFALFVEKKTFIARICDP